MQTSAGRFDIRPLSRSELREVDQRAVDAFGMGSLVLMENAGCGAAQVIDSVAPPGEVVIICGKGNNAGDGYVAARHLQLLGRRVLILQLTDPGELRGDAAANWRIAVLGNLARRVLVDAAAEEIAAQLSRATVIVDAMLGTGGTGDPRPPIDRAIAAANRSSGCRIALDLPSGLDCDTGRPGDPCFRADHTCTFAASKIGFDAPQARAYTGQVHVVSIGVPCELLQQIAANPTAADARIGSSGSGR